MAGVTAALYALQATAAVISGWGSDMLIRSGIPRPWSERVCDRRHAGTGALFAGAAVTNGTTATIMLVASGFTVGFRERWYSPLAKL